MKRGQKTGFILVYIVVFGTVLVGLIAILFGTDFVNITRLTRVTAQVKAEHLADAGLDQSLTRLRQSSGFSGETISLGGGTIETVITAAGLERTLKATATIPNVFGLPVVATRQLVVAADAQETGSAFAYAIQADTGGFQTGQNRNPEVDGNLYSNGDVAILGHGAKVTGNVSAVGTVTNLGTIEGTVSEGVAPEPLPQIDTAGWQALASTGQTHTGDYPIAHNGTVTLGAPDYVGVITGRLLVTGNATIILKGPLWIKGVAGSSLEISSNPRFILDDDVDQAVLLADGRLTFSGNAKFETEEDDSDLLVMTLAPGSYAPQTDAVIINSNTRFVNSGLLAPNGRIRVGSSASGLSITSFTAAGIFVDSNAKIDYAEGLIDAHFSPSGPSGGKFTVVPGSYQVLVP